MSPSSQFHRIQFVSVFERNKSIREKVFDYERAMTTLPKPFKIITVPDDEDPNIPRFQSGNKKQSLEVTQQRLTLDINTEGLQGTKKIQEILDNRLNELRPLILKEKILFVAFILHIRYLYGDESKIYEHFKEYSKAKAAEATDLLGFSLFYAKPYIQKYFLNVNCERFQETVLEGKVGQELKEVENKIGINVVLDMNTRYQITKKIPFEESFIENLKNDIFTLIDNNQLSNFLSGEIK